MFIIPTHTAQERALHYEIPCMPWDIVSADIFMVNKKTLLGTVNYYSKFLIVKKVVSLSANDLPHMAKLIFTDNGLLKNCLRFRHKLHT